MSSIKAPCNRTFKAYRNSGLRPKEWVKWIVMHDTEGGTARSIAHYFSTSIAGGSAHLVVDDKSCYRTLDNSQVPWGAPGANLSGFHIEQCGFARWTNGEWRKHLSLLRRAAYKAAIHCDYYRIPVRFVDAEGLKKGQKGITTHAECTKAFGGDHTDPGPGWPRHLFMGLVRFYSLGV